MSKVSELNGVLDLLLERLFAKDNVDKIISILAGEELSVYHGLGESYDYTINLNQLTCPSKSLFMKVCDVLEKHGIKFSIVKNENALEFN